tara:strand:- start:70 stop:213 length:144 start_codon:yes stop_codon:yes gene_type:complete
MTNARMQMMYKMQLHGMIDIPRHPMTPKTSIVVPADACALMWIPGKE